MTWFAYIQKESWVVQKSLHFFILLLLVVVLLRCVKRLELRLLKKSTHQGQHRGFNGLPMFFQILRILIWIALGLIALELLGIPISGILAFGGVGGIAVGFAAKDLLANFFGGLMILLDQPFKVGDWIRSPDKQIEGDVESIGWRLTRIRTFEKSPLYVPNGMFSNIVIENPSRMSNRKLKATLGLRYEDAAKMPKILSDIRALLLNHPQVDHQHGAHVHFTEFSSSSLDITVQAYIKAKAKGVFFDIRQEIFFTIIEIIERHGAACAFPTTTLQVPDTINIHVDQDQA